MRANEAELRARLEALRDLPIVGDVRGAGYFQALELVKDQATDGAFSTRRERGRCSGASSSPRLYEAGLIAASTTGATPLFSCRRR